MATGAGAAIGMMPLPMAILVAVYLVLLFGTRVVSIASITCTILLPVFAVVFHQPLPYIVVFCLMSAVVLWAHRTQFRQALADGRNPAVCFPWNTKRASTESRRSGCVTPRLRGGRTMSETWVGPARLKVHAGRPSSGRALGVPLSQPMCRQGSSSSSCRKTRAGRGHAQAPSQSRLPVDSCELPDLCMYEPIPSLICPTSTSVVVAVPSKSYREVLRSARATVFLPVSAY